MTAEMKTREDVRREALELGLNPDQVEEMINAAESVASKLDPEAAKKALEEWARDPSWAVRTFTKALEGISEYLKEFGDFSRGRQHFMEWSITSHEKKDFDRDK